MNNIFQPGKAAALALCLLAANSANAFAQTADAAQQPPQAAQQSTEQLRQLVAPIALYPDPLIAQILPAATFPDQVLEAANWMAQHKDLKGSALAAEVDKQSWDPSVKDLTQFPEVLANMRQNLAWTSELGDVWLNQQPELTQAIQTMRQRAKQSGNLQSTSQENVDTKGQSIVIQPAMPDVVYVPQYDPWLVYGEPLAIFPGWYPYPGLYLNGPGIGFELGFGVGLFAGYGWGWHNWGFDWRRGGRVVYNHDTYISHSRAIVTRNGFQSGRPDVGRGGGFHRPAVSRGTDSAHTGAFSGFDHGGIARGNAFRGQSSFGGFHAGGFSGGGFNGGGSRGGGRR